MEKTYDPKKAESRWYPEWEHSGLLEPGDAEAGKPFVITLPPPNVTGILHVGHVLGYTVQDILIRYRRMRGRRTLWVAGTDHAGIATQKVVEKELSKRGTRREDLGRDAFVAEVWRWKEHHHERITAQLKRLGYALDWSREAFTLDEDRSKAVAEVFVRLHEKGYVYRGYYMVNWCPVCLTALSDEEVEMRERDAKLYYIRYPFSGGDDAVVVATTRPETMLGDVAVAIHPGDQRAEALTGKAVLLPVAEREIPVIQDEYVDPEFGTGVVKITPAHDPNDYEVGERHGLEPIEVMDESGRMNALASGFEGEDRFECRKNLLERLEQGGYLDRVEDYRHSVGHHDRCGTIIEPRLSWQWFVRMDDLARPAIEVVENDSITFYPERWKNVYLSWMGQIRDWCISRQLWWGHRIPVWYCDDDECDEFVVSRERPESGPCGGTRWRQDEDVLDTWFSSWLWTFTPLGWPDETEDLREFHPTDVLVTGYEIIFFWVARMIMASLEFVGEIPFRQVYLTGIVRDTRGRKMSKSLGNSPDPLDLAEEYGADALRFTLTMLSPPGQDVYFSADKVEIGRNFANKIWNASRLVLMGAEEPEVTAGDPGGEDSVAELWRETFPHTDPGIDWGSLEAADRWVLSQLDHAVEDVGNALEGQRFNDAAAAIYEFLWHVYCDWYLELIKPRLHGGDRSARETVRAIALLVLGNGLKLLHPFMPFITEEIWDAIPYSRGLVFSSRFPGSVPSRRDQALDDDFGFFRELVGSIRNMRAEMRVPMATRTNLLLSHPEEGDWPGRIDRLAGSIRLLAKVEELRHGAGLPRPNHASATHLRGVDVYVPLEGVIDMQVERDRIEKALDALEVDIGRVESKLENDKFLERAPEDVVEKEREKYDSLLVKRERLRSHLASLAGT